MSRYTGTFNFAANYEGLLKAPIDAKQLVGTYADLTLPATWCASGAVWLYDGAIVAVGLDPTSANNGIYWLCDATNYTMTCSWIKAGAGGTGTITGATNGLSVSGANIKLGGTLTGNTYITDPSGYGIQYGGDYTTTFLNNSLVSKLYVDTIASGLQPKQAVQVATTTNIVLSGLTTIDGISISAGQRVLVKDQVSQINNGVWMSSTGVWTRASDFNGTPSGSVSQGDYLWVITGNTNGGSAWILTSPDPITIGVTPLTFALFSKVSSVTAGAGITVTPSGNTSIIALNSLSQAVVNSALTGATNGLGTDGNRNVCLGGILSASTTINLNGQTFTICGAPGHAFINLNDSSVSACFGTDLASTTELRNNTYNLTLSSSPFANFRDSNCIGLCYDGDYECNFVNRSLITKRYVDTHTSGATGTLTGATNGLSVTGKKIKLGGTLTGATDISGAQDLSFGGITPLTSFGVQATCDFSLTVPNNRATISLDCLGDASLIGGRQAYISTSANTSSVNVSASTVSILGTVKLLTTPNTGSNSDGILVWNPIDKTVKCVTGGAVLTSAITGATNGLTKIGQVAVLGGNLTGNTGINLCNNTLSITGSTASGNTGAFCVAIKDNCSGNVCCSYLDMNVQHVKLGYQCNPIYPYSHIWLDYNGINLYQQCGNIGICTVSPSIGCAGLCYVNNYDTYLTSPRQIPDIGWVSGYTSGYTKNAVTGATNGLTRIGQNIGLGGTLTGNTAININQKSLCIWNGFTIDISACGSGSSATFGNNDTANSYLCGNNSANIISPQIMLQFSTLGYVYDTAGTPTGLLYGGNYRNNFICNSLVDAAYVTGYTQSKSNTVNIYNQSICASFTATTTSDYIGAMSGSCIWLPPTPKACQRISIADISGHALDCMIVIVGNGKCINGADCATVNTDYGSVTLINNGTFWSAIGFIN